MKCKVFRFFVFINMGDLLVSLLVSNSGKEEGLTKAPLFAKCYV